MADGPVQNEEAADFDAGSLKVLVIDDQSHVRNWVRTVLTNAGVVQVTEAADGGQAFAAVTRPGAWFDLILCDLRMPERDGIETIRAFAALGLESAIAIMSGEEEREVAPHRPDDAGMVPESDLMNAFIHEELQLVYQPKLWLHTGKFAGVESLVRWKHPALGLLHPGSFVPLMEGSEDLSASLTEFSLRESITCVGRWRKAGRELRVAINLSARAFDRLDLPERGNTMCLEHRVEPDCITLELTETHVARDAVRLIDVATRLRLKGFTFSIDDFG